VDKEGAEAMTAEHGTPHRARIVEKPDGTYDVGCDVCGHWRYGETDFARADSYLNGHNDAVYGINNNGIPLWFPPTGPNRAISLAELRDLVEMMKTISAQRQRLNAHDLHLAAIDRTLKANGKVIDIVMAAQGWAVPNDPDDLG
jgi:hypothetical protein